jgi:hypothetical protein
VTAAAADGGAADGGAPLAPSASPEASPAPAPPPPAATPAPSPRFKLRGRVLARGTRDAVAAATLAIDAVAAGESGDDGRFELQVTAGRHRLQIQAPGFEPADLPVEAGGADRELVVRLHPRLTGERYETVVSAPKDADGVALAADDLVRTAGSMGEPFRVIESLPGVSQVLWPLSLYAVRGANPGNTGYFLDGMRLPMLFHFALGPGVVHPYLLEKIDFYPGGYPARYGRFVSGVVAASTATPKPDRMRGSVDVRLFDAGGIVATPINEGRGTVAVTGRYSYTALLLSMYSPDLTLSYWDYGARLDHALGPGRLTVFALGSHDYFASEKYSNLRAEIDFHRLDTRWQGRVGPGRLMVRNTLGADRSSMVVDPVVSLPVRIRTKSTAPQTSYLIASEKLDLELGADGELQGLQPRADRADANPELFRDRTALVAGAFTTLTWRITPDVIVVPGFRADAFFEGPAERIEPGPRFGMRFRPFGETWLKAQVGRFSQTASLPVMVPGFESFGLGTIGTQTSKQGSLGVEQPVGDLLQLDVTAFYQRMRLTDLLSLFNYDPTDPRLLELRDGESYGAEFMLRRAQNNRLSGWLSYTLSWSQRLVGPSGARAWSDWDQRHVLNLVSALRLPRGFSVGARFHVNSGRPYPVFDDDNPSPPDYIRLPTFYQLDLRADKRFVFDRYVLDVYVETVNTTLSQQMFDIKRSGGFVEEKVLKIVLPSVGVHAEW